MTRQQARFNHPSPRWTYNLQSLDIENKIMKVQLEVEVQYCHNCQEHAFCSQHDETKYLFHYDKIRETLLQKIQAKDAVIYRRMDPPKHYQKMVNPKETKFYDVRREEEVYFPRLGSFEVYVDGVLIFSKLKANIWPNYETVAETIAEMYKLKQEGKEIYMFEVGYNKDVKEGEKIRQKSASFRKRQLQQGKTVQRDRGEPELNSIQFDQYQKTINTSMMMTTGFQNLSPNGRYANGSSPQGLGEDGKKMIVSTDFQNVPNSVKNYHQIYSSALYELRQQARRERKKEKKKEKEQKYTNSDKLIIPGAEYLEPLLPGRKSKGKKAKKPIKQAILYEHEAEYAPTIPHKKSTVKTIDRQLDEELNLPDIVNPKEYDQQQKDRLYQKYDSPNVDIKEDKQKHETVLDSTKKQEKNQMERIDFLNEKLEMPKIKENNKEMKAIEEDPHKEEMVTPPLPPIKTIDHSDAHPEEKKKTETRKVKTPNTPRSALNKARPSEKNSKHQSDKYLNDFEEDSQHSPVQPKPRRQLLDSLSGKAKSNQAFPSQKEEFGVQMDSPIKQEKGKSDHQKTENEKQKQKERKLNRFSLRQVYDVSMNFNRRLQDIKKSDKKISMDEQIKKPISKNKVIQNVVNETIDSRVQRNEKSPQHNALELERIYRTLPNKMNVDTPEMSKSRKILEIKLAQARERSIERNKSAASIQEMQKSARSKKGSQTDLKANKTVDDIVSLKLSKSQQLLNDHENIKKLVINQQKLNDLPKSKEDLEKLEKQKKQSSAKIDQNLHQQHKNQQKIEMNSDINHEASKMETITHQTEKKSQHEEKHDQPHKVEQTHKIESPKVDKVEEHKELPLKNIKGKPEYKQFGIQTQSRAEIAIQTDDTHQIPKEQKKYNTNPQKIEEKINDQVQEEIVSQTKSQKVPKVEQIPLNMHRIEQKPEQYVPDVDEKAKIPPKVQKEDRQIQTMPEQKSEIVPAPSPLLQKKAQPAVSSITNPTPGVNVSVKIGEINVKMDMTVVNGHKKNTKKAVSQEKQQSGFKEEQLEQEVPVNNSKHSNQQTNISPKKQEKKERKPIIKSQFVPLKLEANKDGVINPFHEYYDYSGNKITKIDGNSLWHCIKFDEPLPSKGKYSFAVEVVSSEMNCLEIGIMPHEFTPIQNRICDKSIGFHFANGKIHDTNTRSKKTTSWRNVCAPAKKGTTGVIELQVDADAQVMHWRVNGRKIAESILTDYLKIRRCVAFISMVHQNDTVRINAQPVMSNDRHREISPYKEDRNQSPAKQQLLLQSKIGLNESTINIRESMLQRNHSKVPTSEPKASDLRQSSLPGNQAELINQTSLPNSPERSSSLNKTVSGERQRKQGVPRIQLHLLKDKIINPYNEFYHQQGDKLVKIRGDGLWHLIKCDQILPNTGRYSFGIDVVSSELNCIEVGIMPQDFEPVQNKICDRSIGFHLANGKIHDTKGDKSKKSTSWRPVKEPFLKGNKAVIQVFVDADAQIIRWKLNGNIFAESILTDYLKNKRCVAYLSAVHKNDTILFNPEPISVKNMSPSPSLSPRRELSISPSRSKSIGKIVKNKSLVKSEVDKTFDRELSKSVLNEPKKEQPKKQQPKKEQPKKEEANKAVQSEPKKEVQPEPKKEVQPQQKTLTNGIPKQAEKDVSKEILKDTKQEANKDIPKESPKQIVKQSLKQTKPAPAVPQQASKQVKTAPQQPPKQVKPVPVVPQENPKQAKTALVVPQELKPAPVDPQQIPKQAKPSPQIPQQAPKQAKPASAVPQQVKPTPVVLQNTSKQGLSAPGAPQEAKTADVVPQEVKPSPVAPQEAKPAQVVPQNTKPESTVPLDAPKQAESVPVAPQQVSKQTKPAPVVPQEAKIAPVAAQDAKSAPAANQEAPKETSKEVSKESLKSPTVEVPKASPIQQSKKELPSLPSLKQLKSEASPFKTNPTQQEQSQLNKTQSPQKRELSATKIRQSIPRITLHLEKDKIINPFIENFEISGNKLIKVKGDGIWHTLKFAEILPETGRYSIGFHISRSSMNCVEIGIMPQQFQSIQNKICEKGIGFHYANGKIHDTKGVKEKKTTSWRPVCEPASKGVPAVIEIFVDADAQIIRWKMNGKVFAESTLTNYLKSKRCVAYISFVHKEDIIELNPEPIKSKPKRQLSPSPKKQETSPSKPAANNQSQPSQKIETPASSKPAANPPHETSVSP